MSWDISKVQLPASDDLLIIIAQKAKNGKNVLRSDQNLLKQTYIESVFFSPSTPESVVLSVNLHLIARVEFLSFLSFHEGSPFLSLVPVC